MATPLLFILGTALVLAAAPPLRPARLGSGQRGLVLTRLNPLDPNEKKCTIVIAYHQHPGFPMASGFLKNDPQTVIVHQETLDPEYEKTIPSRFWSGWTSLELFSFDKDAAFDGRDLYRIEKGHLRIYPYVAQAEARRRYGLKENEIFLGAFDGRAFYWVKGQPRTVYVRSGSQVRRFELGKRVTEPLGMAKGDPKGDLALHTVMLPAGFFSFSPRTLGWVVLDLKDAR